MFEKIEVHMVLPVTPQSGSCLVGQRGFNSTAQSNFSRFLIDGANYYRPSGSRGSHSGLIQMDWGSRAKPCLKRLNRL